MAGKRGRKNIPSIGIATTIVAATDPGPGPNRPLPLRSPFMVEVASPVRNGVARAAVVATQMATSPTSWPRRRPRVATSVAVRAAAMAKPCWRWRVARPATTTSAHNPRPDCTQRRASHAATISRAR